MPPLSEHSSGFDAEVLGGDTCDICLCCVDPAGYAVSKLSNKPLSHHAFLVFYPAGWISYFVFVWTRIQSTDAISDIHLIISVGSFATAMLVWGMVSIRSPGRITMETMATYDNYPYDNVLYENRMCPTKHIRKLARSKFDRYSGDHVPRFDHFCSFLNQSVGEENYRLFLLFVGLHAGICGYGTWQVYALALEKFHEGLSFVDPLQMRRESKLLVSKMLKSVMQSYWNAFTWDLAYLVGLFLFLLVSTTLLVGFFCFHCYLVGGGMTTNEYYKRKQIKGAENVYNLGITRNIGEVLFPRSLRAHNKRN